MCDAQLPCCWPSNGHWGRCFQQCKQIRGAISCPVNIIEHFIDYPNRGPDSIYAEDCATVIGKTAWQDLQRSSCLVDRVCGGIYHHRSGISYFVREKEPI